ncbi:hypothetical protein ACQKJZ_04500 [Sphingomonas sp. NPDC019816]|uniref:hypothetical protein n=1 Tax=Sphingomonas sp. NPDC019816 TaxID=3390679 RepID=UPI003D01B83B
MSNDKGHATAIFIVGAAVIGLVVANGKSGQTPPAPKPTATTPANGGQRFGDQAIAQRMVRNMLKDPSSAEFSEVHTGWSSGTPVTCGYVNSRNGFGGMTGRQRFISGNVTALEESMAPGEMGKVWDRMC